MNQRRAVDREPFITPRKMIQWAQALCFAMIPALVALRLIQGNEVMSSDIMAMTTLAAIGTGSHAGLKWADLKEERRSEREPDDEISPPAKRQPRVQVVRRRSGDDDQGLLRRLRYVLAGHPPILQCNPMDDRHARHLRRGADRGVLPS